MSQFGINLFARANPPPQMGYLSDAERACARVAGLDGTEAANSTPPQKAHCSTSFKLYCLKLGKVGWKTVKTKKVFALTLNIGLLSLVKFCSLVAPEAGKVVDGADEPINNAVPKGTLSWQMDNPVAVEKEAQIAVDIRTHMLTERAAQIAAGSASASATSVPGSNPKASNFNALDVVMNHIYAKHLPNIKYMSKWPVHIDSTDPCQYIPLMAHNTQLWAGEISKEVNGVKYNAPPALL
ncbi:hypothetical protein PTTG_27746 [Puccinia triticina 1-1 BBBD Race 1]|uniref:Uncharacterized protein n=1 Tax=Puccinia triticina (isolate 1-1 / race 1 (BBBD)) TaxID=630390 RepID=A0A180GH77_PUCT1|nr:hypothetical protein PTTG_27746 [Puccinia triticina 1-1 BBBD Race 1]